MVWRINIAAQQRRRWNFAPQLTSWVSRSEAKSESDKQKRDAALRTLQSNMNQMVFDPVGVSPPQ
jgi:hypothetical protein